MEKINIENGIKIRLAYRKLPQNLQYLYFSEKVTETVNDVAKKYGLDDKSKNKLGNEIGFVILGIKSIESFRTNLVQELGIPYDVALNIASDTNASVFSSVINDLKQISRNIPTDQGAKKENSVEDTPRPRPEPQNPAIIQLNKKETRIGGMETDPDHMIVDHEEMERVDGIHLHSQTVMPTGMTEQKPKKHSFFSFGSKSKEENMPASKTIDDKLRGIVRSPVNPDRNPSQSQENGHRIRIEGERPDPYAGNDPYREPLN